MVEFVKMICTKRHEQDNKNRTKIAEDRCIVYLALFIKLVFGQSNTFYIGISSPLILKTDSLAIFSGSDRYVIMCFFKACGYRKSRFFMVLKIFI